MVSPTFRSRLLFQRAGRVRCIRKMTAEQRSIYLEPTRRAILVSAALLTACKTKPVVPPPAIGEKGWEAFGAARTGDAPGTVFRRASDGRLYRVVGAQVQISSQSWNLFRIEKETDLSLGEVLEGIGVLRQSLPIALQAKLGYRTSYTRAATKATLEYFDDTSVPAINDALSRVAIRADNEYFVIRETISATDVSFNSKSGLNTELALIADIKTALKSTTTASVTTGSSVSFEGSFGKPHRVWYKAEPLAIKRLMAVAGQPGVMVSLQPREHLGIALGVAQMTNAGFDP
jgi:hypothetical protein